MNVGERHYRTIWLSDDKRSIEIIDQRWLPHEFRIEKIGTAQEVVDYYDAMCNAQPIAVENQPPPGSAN